MDSARVIVWFSRGAASAIAARMTLQNHPRERVHLVFCATGSEHPDSDRFQVDFERVVGVTVETIASEKYRDTWQVWEERRYLAGIDGALCTTELKIFPRLTYQRPGDIHVFGYTSDGNDQRRAQRLRLNYPDMKIETPLIDAGLSKAACLAMIEGMGIDLPIPYRLGFANNNCIPCVKATSPNYWALVRKTHPAEFQRMVTLSRDLGVRLCRIDGERAFIDEIPDDWPVTEAIAPACDFLCHLASMGLEDAA